MLDGAMYALQTTKGVCGVAWLHDGDVRVRISTICVWTLCVYETLSVGIVFGIHKNQCFLVHALKDYPQEMHSHCLTM